MRPLPLVRRLGLFVALAFSASTLHAAVPLPNGQQLEQVDFERHVMGVLGRSGCNAGSCHGSFQGKGGFRLSLFGFEPDKDHRTITRESLGRRINSNDPDGSLLLLKACGKIEHAGGKRFEKDSWQYQLLRNWIAAGSVRTAGSGDVQEIILTPNEIAFKKKDEISRVKVEARFADGSVHNITTFCDFRTIDDSVAEVTNLGEIKSVKPGTTVIVVNYRSNVLPVRVLVPVELPEGVTYPKIAENNYIDREVFAKLRLLNMIPSDLSTDEEFLRRVTIDTIGQLPSPEEVRTFLADKNPDKRAKKIDDLLNHPLHAALWATKFCDITGNDTVSLENPQQLKPKRSQMWHDWFRKRLQENMPYDEIVHGVLCATSRDGRTPDEWIEEVRKLDEAAEAGHDYQAYADRKTLDLYWKRQQPVPPEQWGEKTAAAFMGVRIECAQCHKHPFDRWTQIEYRAYANIFGNVASNVSPESRKVVEAENAARKAKAAKPNQQVPIREVFVSANAPKSLLHPETNSPLTPRALGGPEIKAGSKQDLREELFAWLSSPENPFFSRSFVNRVWGHYLGIGIVHPIDDFSQGNPPSNEKLLDALAKEFSTQHYDIRHIERQILNSRVYQLSAKVNATNRFDKNNYAHSYLRPMLAEAVLDVVNSALGATEKWGPEIRPGSKAVEVGSTLLLNPKQNYPLRVFGRPPRSSACDCERAMDPALPQKLYMMIDQTILEKLNDPQGRVVQLTNSKLSDDEVLDELFLATLCRHPRASEREAFAENRTRATDRKTALVDTIWALINTREFILNH